MEIKRTGLILYVKKYKECILFYKTILELDILFQNEELTCFDFYGIYLMVEKEDRIIYLNVEEKSRKNYNCIRLNVNDVKKETNDLKNKGVIVDYQEHHWGKVAKFFDPDGNFIAFKDEEGFVKQLKNYRLNSK
ncbi:VOC family protein [Aquimarina longa]|uniref:VOC family protein n=1 Tax=Aquimarina longa TaxID=1080221 RepID=UPI0007867575|nr:VOC family protein [Aquimarina longa]